MKNEPILKNLKDLVQHEDDFVGILKSILSEKGRKGAILSLRGGEEEIRQILNPRWVHEHLPDQPPEAVQLFILMVLYYCFEAFRKVRNDPKQHNWIWVAFARFIFPAYEIYIEEDPNEVAVIKSDEDAKRWLLEPDKLANTLKGFGISIDNHSVAYLQESLKARQTITVYRWSCDGLRLIHTELCGGVGIRPTSSERGKIKPAVKNAGNDNPQDGQVHGVSAESPELSTPPIGENAILISPETPPPGEFRSPLLDVYWKNPDVKNACYHLSQEGQTCTPLAVARTILNRKLDLTNLDGNQKILAMELLVELVYENALPGKWGKMMSRLNVEKNWLHSHIDNLSPILKALIEAGLIAVDEVNIKIENRLIHDYLIGRINAEAGANPLPPGIGDYPLSTWLYWLLINLIDKNELGLAGAVAWAVQGGQIGYSSQTWHQLRLILDLLPETAFSNYSLWSARSIIKEINYEYAADPKSSCAVQLDDRQVDRSDRRAGSFISFARNYGDNLKKYLKLSHNSGMNEKDFSIFIISNMGDLPPEYRDDGHILLLHSLSQVRLLSSGNDLTSKRKLHFNVHEGHVYIDELSIRDIILHEAKRVKPVYLNWFAEPLAAWGCTEIVKCIKKKKSGDAFIDARGEILIRAVEGNEDYQSWI